jgi:hypothetical protein
MMKGRAQLGKKCTVPCCLYNVFRDDNLAGFTA